MRRPRPFAVLATAWLTAAGGGVVSAVGGQDRPCRSDPHQAARVSEDTLYTEPIFSPDGRSIAYAAGLWPALDIWIAGADGSRARALTDDPVNAYQPRWSADGTGVVFASNRSGKYQVLSIGADGSNLRAVTPASEFDDDEPDLSADGERVVIDRTGTAIGRST